MIRPLFLSAAILVLSSASDSPAKTRQATTTAQQRALTLQAAVNLALKQNPDILKAVQEIERTRGQYIEVRAQALPNLAASGQYSQNDPQLIGSSTEDKSWSIALQLTQTIYSGGKVRAAVKIADLSMDSSYQLLRETVSKVVATVRGQFYNTLLKRDLIAVSEESIQLLTEQLTDQQNRFNAGTVPRFNVLQAEVALANAQPDLIRARNNYHISRLELGKTLGLDTNQTPGVIGELRMPLREANLGRALSVARKSRALLKAQKDTISSEEQQIVVAKSGYKPKLDANVGYQFQNARGGDLARVNNGWYLGVTGSWSVWDGYETKGKIDQAQAHLASAKVSLADSIQQVELEVQKAYAEAKVSREVIASQLKVVEQATEALRLAKERLNAGAGTQLDVLNARLALTTARTTQKQALADYNVALAEYDRSVGAETFFDETVLDPKAKEPVAKLRKGNTTLRPAD